MNIQQAKAKLASISSSSSNFSRGTKRPEVLVGELCVVVKFLLDEIDRHKDPINVLHRTFSNPDPPNDKREPPDPPNPLKPELPQRSRPINSPNPYRKGNAGDAE